MSILRKIKTFLRPKSESNIEKTSSESVSEVACCSPAVHIAFRGLGDERLYLTRDRQWQEVRYYRPNGLRVFCAGCRRRLI